MGVGSARSARETERAAVAEIRGKLKPGEDPMFYGAEATPTPKAGEIASERVEHVADAAPVKAGGVVELGPRVAVKSEAEVLRPEDGVFYGDEQQALSEAPDRKAVTALGMGKKPGLARVAPVAPVPAPAEGESRSLFGTVKLGVAPPAGRPGEARVTDAAVGEILKKSVGGRTERGLPPVGREAEAAGEGEGKQEDGKVSADENRQEEVGD
ncbi:MAG: hypothetical protein HY907_11185 [Deltaproteobacteria bacterium]|nr:hypothetical protein [Deltaproteobacteria bacterium]